MEKGYRDYGHDIDNTDSVLEAGLGFAVDLKKPGGFIGKEAVVAKKAAGPLTRRLVMFPPPLLALMRIASPIEISPAFVVTFTSPALVMVILLPASTLKSPPTVPTTTRPAFV